MKNLKKVLAVATAIAALSMSMTAFAATTYTPAGDLAFTYDQAANTVSVTATALEAAKADTEMTLVVLDKAADETAVTAADILYIDQETVGTANAFQAMGLKAASLADGVYKVKLGYTDADDAFQIKAGTLTVATAADGVQITFIFGDVDGSGKVENADAAYIASKVSGGTAKVGTSDYSIGDTITDTQGNTIIFGDVDGSGKVENADAAYIASKVSGGTAKVGTSDYSIGESVTLTVPSAN